MAKAAPRLSPLRAPQPGAPEVSFLTGKRFWYQTVFCAWSLGRSTGAGLSFTFYDDGSIDRALADEAARLFPDSRIVTAADADARLDRVLSPDNYPALRSQRRSYLHLRKLTDVHAGRQGWNTVLDSDMLFFRQPRLFLGWLSAPNRPIHMVDVKNAYGYSEASLSALVGKPVPARVNVGICGLRSDALDWEQIEDWCASLLAAQGTSYYLEQALVALLMAGESALALPAADYRLLPDDAECRHPTAIMHHYVDLSKRGYFRHAWKNVSLGDP